MQQWYKLGFGTATTGLFKVYEYHQLQDGLTGKIIVNADSAFDQLYIKFSRLNMDQAKLTEIWGAEDANLFVSNT